MNKSKKKITKYEIFYLIILLISLIIMISGAVMAYFSASVSQEENGTKIYSGTLVINYIDGTEVHNPELFPRMAPTNVNDIENAYVNRFGVESSGTLDQYLTVSFDVNKNEFSKGSLKYSMFNNDGKLIKSGDIPQSGRVEIAGSTYLAAGGTTYFTFMVWLEETGTNQDSEQGKNFTGSIVVDAIQSEAIDGR